MYSQKSLLGNDMMAWNEYGPDPCGTTGMSYAAAMLATLMSSVRPPSHMTSGCKISTARFSMSFRKPYLTNISTDHRGLGPSRQAHLEYSCSPVVNLTCGKASLSLTCPSKSSG